MEYSQTREDTVGISQIRPLKSTQSQWLKRIICGPPSASYQSTTVLAFDKEFGASRTTGKYSALSRAWRF